MPAPSRFAKENEPLQTSTKARRGRKIQSQPSLGPLVNPMSPEGVPPRLRGNLGPALTPTQAPRTPHQSFTTSQPGSQKNQTRSQDNRPLTSNVAPVSRVPPPSHRARTKDFDEQHEGIPAQPDSVLAGLKAELEESRRRLAESEACQNELRAQLLRTNVSRPSHKSLKVVPIPKPKGEAGDGFQLRQAMGLDDHEAKRILYTTIRHTVHICARTAGVDFSKTYSHQSCEVLADVFKAVRQTHPYLTPTRFPNDWATAELLKQYIRNVRAQERRNRMQVAQADLDASYADTEETTPTTRNQTKRAANIHSDSEGSDDTSVPSKRRRISHLRPEEYHPAGQQPEAGPSRYPQVLFADEDADYYDNNDDNNQHYGTTSFNAEDDGFY